MAATVITMSGGGIMVVSALLWLIQLIETQQLESPNPNHLAPNQSTLVFAFLFPVCRHLIKQQIPLTC